MPWKKTANVAMYEGADWSGYLKTVSNSSPEQARRIALLNPEITFFFFCRQSMVLTNPEWQSPRFFEAGDAVFFTGKPWYGSAPQCDSYEKNGMSIAYIDVGDINTRLPAGSFVTADGGAAVDVVCIFHADINRTLPDKYTRLAPDVKVPPGGTLACASPYILEALQSGDIERLQAKGITVLLSVMNNHDEAGWAEFTSASDAELFAQQLEAAVKTYGVDGIDIDDEFSEGEHQPSSLAMVTTFIKRRMPEKILSKALFQDLEYFGIAYDGATLEQNLTYGWEMSYGGDPQDRLPPYVDVHMKKNTLSLGFWSRQPSGDPTADVAWLKKNEYEGVMVYGFEFTSDSILLGSLVNDWCGPGNWNL